MNTKKLLIMALVAMYATSTWAYDFSAVAPTGQTLYYKIVSGNAQVVKQNTFSAYTYTTYPTGDLTIPDSVTWNGTTYAVTSIGSSAFSTCMGLTSVTIPDGVTSISDRAFDACTMLTSINIPDGVTSISEATFYNCYSLTSVTIGNGVTSIGKDAFCRCFSLESITIPNSVTFLGDYAFAHCSSLTSVTISDNITSIGTGLFYRCRSINCVTIPDRVTSIGSYAFFDCSSLTSVTIGNGVTWIDCGAFKDCSGLRVMRMKPATPPTLFNYSSICDSIIDLVVPHNSYYDYTQSWNDYTRHHIFADSAFVTIRVKNNAWGYVTGCANDTVFTYPYSDTAEIELVATPYPGYHFVRWDDYTTDSIRTITNIIHDITVKAHFAHDHNNDIDGVDALNAKVYSSQRQIIVEGAEGNLVTLYDVNGRMLTAKQDYDMPLRFDVPVSGTYLVKIGNHPAKKVIVVR